jgi:hypothetical protein
MKRFIVLVPVLTLLCLPAASGQTKAERQGFEVMQKFYEQMTTKNFRSDVTMQLIDRSGRIQTRHVKRLSKTDENDKEKFLIMFVDPPTVRHTALLILEHENKDDDVWYYLPAIKRIKRISGTNMASSYVGTEFSYKDIRREKVDPARNRYVLVKKETLRNVEHSVIDAFPVSRQEKDEQGYLKRRLWVRSDNHLVSQAEFYADNGKHLKTLVASDMRPVGNSGKYRYFKMTMTSRKGVKTIISFEMMCIDNREPADKFFTKAFLTRKK